MRLLVESDGEEILEVEEEERLKSHLGKYESGMRGLVGIRKDPLEIHLCKDCSHQGISIMLVHGLFSSNY